jgi:multidrug resistance efflux pump
MIEGLAIWALFIYLLRLIGMPWNKFTQSFSYLGGLGWLLFVWVGLINYTPMDLSGGSVVQSPHIQLRPDSTSVRGKTEKIYIEPNQTIEKGQLIYKIDDTAFVIALKKAQAQYAAASAQLDSALQEIVIAESSYDASLQQVETAKARVSSSEADLKLQEKTLQRYKKLDVEKAKLNINKARLTVASRRTDIALAEEAVAQATWDLESTTVRAPTDGFVTNFILREGQRVSVMPRIQMYTNEKYVLMRVNHQAIRNVKKGQLAEFASSVYPGKIFAAEVEGIVEATGEAQGSLLGMDESVRMTTGQNVQNKHHFVRLKIDEPEGYDIPVGSVGLAWVSGEKPIGFMSFLDVIRGIIIRMKSQLYYFYSV